jgi:hypothetical protein
MQPFGMSDHKGRSGPLSERTIAGGLAADAESGDFGLGLPLGEHAVHRYSSTTLRETAFV